MNYDHLLNILVKANLDDRFIRVYAGRWDVWLVNNGHIEEFTMLILKTDDQLKKILEHARTRAEAIKNSPLSKALLFVL